MANTGVNDGRYGHGHAVVVGAGIAGLTAARALAGFMDRVTVIERDRVPAGPVRRRGLPQARHTHSLSAAALQGLEQLFPGIGGDLSRAGAVRVGVSRDVLVWGRGGWLTRFDSDLSVLCAGRDLIDSVIRGRLGADPRVTFRQGHEVVSLQPGEQDTVTGVWVRERRRGTPDGWGPRRLISADFVVDASGRGSPAPRWLAELGYKPPRETVADTATTHTSAVFAPPLGHVADWKALLLMAPARNGARAVLSPLEGGRWSLTLSTRGTHKPPADHTQLLHTATTLGHHLLADILRTATPLGPVYNCTHTPHRRRHYEKLRRWPDQFIVVGDGLTALDPTHGQGMTLAIQSAQVLQHMLATHGTPIGISYRLRRALAHRLTPAWKTATSLHAAQHDRNTLGGRLRHSYAQRLAAAATSDRHAATMLLHSLHSLHAGTGPERTALRVRALWAALRGPRDPAPAAPPSTTHGPHAPRPHHATVPGPPAIGVHAGTARRRPATGSSARWTTTEPAYDRPQQ